VLDRAVAADLHDDKVHDAPTESAVNVRILVVGRTHAVRPGSLHTHISGFVRDRELLVVECLIDRLAARRQLNTQVIKASG